MFDRFQSSAFCLAWWSPAGKNVLLAFRLRCFILAALYSFPFDTLGRMWNSFLSVPDHCLSSSSHCRFEHSLCSSCASCPLLTVCNLTNEINSSYDGVDAKTRTSQASFQIIKSHARLCRAWDKLQTRVRFPCRDLNTIIDYFSHTYHPFLHFHYKKSIYEVAILSVSLRLQKCNM